MNTDEKFKELAFISAMKPADPLLNLLVTKGRM